MLLRVCLQERSYEDSLEGPLHLVETSPRLRYRPPPIGAGSDLPRSQTASQLPETRNWADGLFLVFVCGEMTIHNVEESLDLTANLSTSTNTLPVTPAFRIHEELIKFVRMKTGMTISRLNEAPNYFDIHKSMEATGIPS